MAFEKAPAFQFYAAEYLAEENTAVFSLEEEGAYIRAIAFCWREGTIPADPVRLAKLIGKGCTEDTARVVQGCFNQSAQFEGRMVHPRLEIERKKQAEWRAKSSEGGKLSGKARRHKGVTRLKGGSKGGSRVVEPNTNSSSTSTIRDTTRSSISSTGASPPAPPIEYPPALRTDPVRVALADWVTYRKEARKPITRSGLNAILKKYAARPDALIADVQHSIAMGYQGLFPPGLNGHGPPANRKPTFQELNPGLLEEIAAYDAGRKTN